MLKNYRLYSVVLLLFAGVLAIHAQEDEVKGAHPWKSSENKNFATELSHWSLIFDAGFNTFDGDFSSEMKHPVGVPAVGLGVEYSFSPLLGIGVDYSFDWYRVTGDGSSRNADLLLQGYMHKAGGYLTVDLMGGFAPKAQRKLLAVQLFAGGGLGFYRNTTYYAAEQKGNTANAEALSSDEYTMLPYVNIGLGVEFNVSRSIALGVRGEYSYFTKDNVDNRYPALRSDGSLISGASTNNDGLVDVTITLRYKIDAVRKTHVRNAPSDRWLWEQQLQRQLAALPQGRDTVIIYHRDSVIYREAEVRTAVVEPSRYVYFEHGESALTDDGLITIQQIAAQAEQQPEQYIVITGYCDNTGSAKVNNALGEARAEQVAQELIAEYGIPADHVATCGRGSIVSRTGKNAYAANRRAEVRIVSQEEFEQFKNHCEQGNAPQAPEALSVDKSWDASSENLPLWAIASEVLDKDATLAKFARKYYKNTHCWVYIYQANRALISNPNKLPVGTTIVIPGLTDAQRAITKDQCLDLYNTVRGQKK